MYPLAVLSFVFCFDRRYFRRSLALLIADPDAFFIPIDRFNERYDEPQRRPEGRTARVAQPRDRAASENTFVGLHLANHPKNLDEVSGWLRRYPNMKCEIAARIGELGRQPRRAQKLFDELQVGFC